MKTIKETTETWIIEFKDSIIVIGKNSGAVVQLSILGKLSAGNISDITKYLNEPK